MSEVVIKIEDLYKKYRLGAICGGTLTADLQSWWAKVRGKEDPNTKIGAKTYGKNETFMALNGINLEVRKGETLGMSREEVASKIEDIIEFSEYRQFIDTPAKRYSSGMFVKLAFSVAAHLDSEILIMDELGENEINLTDSDARTVKFGSHQGTDVGYNIQAVVDAKNKLITTFEVSNFSAD